MSDLVYEIVTNEIIKKLEEKGEWIKSWTGSAHPRNLATVLSGKKGYEGYNGMNRLLLSCSKFSSPYWLTWKQCQELGGKVKDEESKNSSYVTFWKFFENKKKEGEEETRRRVPFLRYSRVYNVEQCEGLEDKVPKEKVTNTEEKIAACEAIVAGMPMKPEIKYQEQRAFYNPNFDFVNMPRFETFNGAKEFYSTLFHELAHSTGHEKRLHRKDFSCNFFGDHNYSREELVAELTAAFLCADTGIESATINNSAAYIRGWISKLKQDNKLIVRAASQAEKAAKFIKNEKVEREEDKNDTGTN